MNSVYSGVICGLLSVILWLGEWNAYAAEKADVVIYGGTPAGIAAALAASGEGKKVYLVEPTTRIGGLTTNGLSHTDFKSFEALNGTFYEFSRRVESYYAEKYGKNSQQVEASWRGTHGEPSVNLRIFKEMLAEQPSIRVLTGLRLADVEVAKSMIRELHFRSGEGEGRKFQPRMVIDATYEGDLMAAAGVAWRVGREGREEYGESLAPEQEDGEVQGYNYRLCMTKNPENRVPIPVPEGYKREDYAAVIPLVERGEFKAAFGYPGTPYILKAHLPALPNEKRDINDVSRGLVRLSLPEINDGYPDGDLATRRKIERAHLDWQLGLIHFLQTDEALPGKFRAEAAEWGLCKDEFEENGHVPLMIYVREGRRMVGRHVYTESDTQRVAGDIRSKLHPDAVAIGDYSHNCHGTSHEGPRIGGKHVGEFYKTVHPYQIPYGVIVPKEMGNLLVPVACSASHVGFSALRLEPVWTSLGQAAGHAARLTMERGGRVQDLDVSLLQNELGSDGAALIYTSDVAPGDADFAVVQWWGVRGGFHGLTGEPKKDVIVGKSIISQYREAWPMHEAKLGEVLDAATATHWNALYKKHGLPAVELPTVDGKVTRGDWLRAAKAAESIR